MLCDFGHPSNTTFTSRELFFVVEKLENPSTVSICLISITDVEIIIIYSVTDEMNMKGQS